MSDDVAVYDRLIGVWRLVSVEARDGTGSVTRPYGESPAGYIVYTVERRMIVSMMRSPVPSIAATDLFGGVVEAVGKGHVYVGYSGAVTLEDVRHDGATVSGTVVHHLDTCSFPTWVGTEQRRDFVLNGDGLTLTTPRIERAGTQAIATVVWDRLRADW